MPQYGVLERLFAYLRHHLRIADEKQIAEAIAKRQHAEAQTLTEKLGHLATKQAVQAKSETQAIVERLQQLESALASATTAQTRALDKVQERLHDTVKRQSRLELAH